MKNISNLFLFFIFSISFFNSVYSQPPGEWMWIHGSNTPNATGNWGIIGVTSPNNVPPAVYEPCEWTDHNGNFWIFGGLGSGGEYGALWKYNPTMNQWVWMNGSNIVNYTGSYGVQGIPSATNNPPCRAWGATSWVDSNGNLWMFGGLSGGNTYSDLWKYDVSTNEWTWMKGPNTPGQNGIYGVQEVPDTANVPGCRWETSAGWTDNTGNLWLFGGFAPGGNNLNDLWKYNMSTNMWVWMKGANDLNQAGIYGTLMTEDLMNTPGGRAVYSHWKDSMGNLWLFGGRTNSVGNLNDLWKYNIATNNWTWMSGSNLPDASGVYGTQCLAWISNIPGARFESRACWTDQCGNFWMFGGTLSTSGSITTMNDLWMYNPANNLWKWISGNNTTDPIGNWGVIGVANIANHPDGRTGNVMWGDNNGYLYFFGGGSNQWPSSYNDLWRFAIDLECGSCVQHTSVVPINLYQDFFYLIPYPNPFPKGLSFHIYNSSHDAISLFVFDVIGREVETCNTVNENTLVGNNLMKGIYFIEVRQGNNICRLRVVKQ